MDHEANWQIYPSQLKEEFALFAVDMGAAEVAPVPEFPHMHWLRVNFTTSRDDGMPDADEAAQLGEVEEWWAERMTRGGGLHVGRMTCAGRRELFGYRPTDELDDILAEGRRLFGERYDFEANVRPDPQWEVYSGFLYPDAMAQQRISNFKVVTQLRHHGDDPTIVRPIDHFAYFPSEDARAQYVEEIVEAGFEVTAQDDDDEKDHPFTVSFQSHNGTDLATIDAIVLPLWLRARDLGGNYDGWGSPIMKADDESQ